MRRTLHCLLRPGLAALSLLGCIGLTRPAAAQDAVAAKALFDSGLADMQIERYDAGCAKLAESLRLDRLAGTLFTLAVCESRWGHIATAVARYEDFLRLYEHMPPDEQTQQSARAKAAAAERGRLIPELPLLTLSLSQKAPPGTVIQRNGKPVEETALGNPVPVDPGEVVITTQVPGGPLWEQRIAVGKGEKKQLTLELKLPAAAKAGPQATPPPAESQPPAGDGKGQRTAAYVAGAAGIAGLALGVITGGLAIGKKGVIDEHCGGAVGSKDPHRCDFTGRDAAHSLGTLGLVSTIGFAVGGAGVGTGVVLLVTAPKSRKPDTGRPAIRASAGVLSVGPHVLLVGARGIW